MGLIRNDGTVGYCGACAAAGQPAPRQRRSCPSCCRPSRGATGPTMRLFSDPQLNPAAEHGWRRRWFDIIYRHDTPPARNFDLVLVVAILASVGVIMLDSVAAFHARHARVLYALEWGFTLLFTLEYLLRLATVRRP